MELKLGDGVVHVLSLVILIVPYGIETYQYGYCSYAEVILIVPYGIETKEVKQKVAITLYFNCTLWN